VIHVMSKGKYSMITWLQCKLVIAPLMHMEKMALLFIRCVCVHTIASHITLPSVMDLHDVMLFLRLGVWSDVQGEVYNVMAASWLCENSG